MRSALCLLFALSQATSALHAQEDAFFGAPPMPTTPPSAVHERNRPQQPVIQPGAQLGDAPSDAIILFDGSSESFGNWRHEETEDKREADWLLEDGGLIAQKGAGSLLTRDAFGDCQLHLEWAAPLEASAHGQRKGNSGVFLMGMVELKILDNYENPTYADGTAGAIYALMPPDRPRRRGPRPGLLGSLGQRRGRPGQHAHPRRRGLPKT